MRILAAILVLALVIVPVLGCGGGGGGCVGQCGYCSSSFDCCSPLLCLANGDGTVRCSIVDPPGCP